MEKVSAELLHEMVARLVEEFDPEQIILFGSHAWGTPNADSDVDLFVIVSESQESPIQRMLRAYTALEGMGVPKDILVKTRAEVDFFSPVYASLEAEVLERGVVLYNKVAAAETVNA